MKTLAWLPCPGLAEVALKKRQSSKKKMRMMTA
eukprot:CAMPEP_0172761630 /NCGR_PEP_ID=MMETSP1074-20121228/171911_1 /TAXON_ID=2916 /ORGANISM="Ceratium fusus, Strain PA161109" /LENGTH=32 /DNA_ID= /DNA_START= /DNA_END= /DNA_ORIENTATION=